MLKFNRTYVLRVQAIDGQFIEIANPFTLELFVSRHINKSLNESVFKITNLQNATRNRIFKDYFSPQTDIRQVELYAGYGSVQPLIFAGTIRDASSYKMEGAVNVTTEINAYGGGFEVVNSFTSKTIGSPQQPVTRAEVISSLLTDLTLPVGKVSDFPGTHPRGVTLIGPTWNLLQTYTGNRCFIDNGYVFCLTDQDHLDDSILFISDETGLLGTPRRYHNTLVIEILFEPRLKVGQVIQLESRINSFLNGIYRVAGFDHVGTISNAVSGKMKTIITVNTTGVFVPGVSVGTSV